MSEEAPVSGAYADYRGKRYLVLSGGKDWVTLCAGPDVDIPEAFDRGQYRLAPGLVEPYAKVPLTAINGVLDVVVTARLEGHSVSLQARWADGRIRIGFVGPPSVARQLGLDGDQFMGWSGLVDATELGDVHVEERAR